MNWLRKAALTAGVLFSGSVLAHGPHPDLANSGSFIDTLLHLIAHAWPLLVFVPLLIVIGNVSTRD